MSLLKWRSPELLLLGYNSFDYLFALIDLLLLLNSILLYALFQYPLKSSDNFKVFQWFQGALKENIVWKWVNVTTRDLGWSTFKAQCWLLDPLPLYLIRTCTLLGYLHYPPSMCTLLLFANQPLQHQLTNNAFRYLSTKNYQALNQLETINKMLLTD